jgi:Uma2 family endonuclease
MLMPLPRTKTGRLTHGAAGVRMTLEEFQNFDDFEEGLRFELIRGVLVVTPSPAPSHWSINDELGRMLRNYAESHPQGKCLSATIPELDVITSIGSRRADRVIWLGLDRVIDPKTDVPTIIAEIVSPGKAGFYRDFEQKRDEYLALGCVVYWAIDPNDLTTTIFRRLQDPEVVPATGAYTTPLLPGFELNLEQLCRAANAFQK